MRVIFAGCFLLLSISLPSCSSTGSPGQNSANLSTAASPPAADPEWPYPDWAADPAAIVDKGNVVIFQAEKLTDLTLLIPADWDKITNKPSFLLYKSPTVESRFANLVIQSSNTKPIAMYPVDPKKNFDYSGFEPDAAYKHFLDKKTEDPASGRIQQITVDGVWGILEQVKDKESTNANSAPKEPQAVWQWTTFMRSKIENNKFEIAFVYPSSEMDKFKVHIAGFINSVRIKRTPGVVMLESQP